MKINNLACSMQQLLPFATLLSFGFNSCSNQKMTHQPEITYESPPSSLANSPIRSRSIFTKTVGASIDRTTALLWMNNFALKNKENFIEYFISAETLITILTDSSCVGVSFHYALDNNKKKCIIPIGIDTNGKFIPANLLMIGDKAVDWATAWQWINSYTGKVRSHFFGAFTLSRFIITQKIITVRASIALNDKNMGQLLLSNANISFPESYLHDSTIYPTVGSSNTVP